MIVLIFALLFFLFKGITTRNDRDSDRASAPYSLEKLGFHVIANSMHGANWDTYIVEREGMLYSLEAYAYNGHIKICCVEALQQFPSTINLNINEPR